MFRRHSNFVNEVRQLIEPYLVEGSVEVRNPVLLLNFLHQHHFIDKPSYDVKPHLSNAWNTLKRFVGICFFNEIRTEALGTSKKEAKSQAAQKALHCLLGKSSFEMKSNSSPSLSYLFEDCKGDGREKFYLDDTSDMYLFEDGDAVIVEPQCDFFEPSSFDLPKHQEPTIYSPLATESHNIKEPVNFFDPFCQLRPDIGPECNGQSTDFENMLENVCNKSSELIEESLGAPSGSTIRDNKTPVQLLQELAIKKLKLIPRCTVTTIDTGFKCTIVVGEFSGEGMSPSKKQAKTQAALDLLSQIQ